MRLVGEHMVVGIKDAAKLLGISVIACCAILVCTMFLNFNIDIAEIRSDITSEQVMRFYEAQVSTAKVVSGVSGGCLLITSVIMLTFYIKHYIDAHKKELGILKALGYADFHIAKHFWVFGSSIFIGTALGFGGAFLLMPTFYRLQNADGILPEFTVHFHPILFVCLVLLPTAVFSALSVFYACFKLKKPVLSLLRDTASVPVKSKKRAKKKDGDCPFLTAVKRDTLRSKKALAFLVVFAAFCFSSMTQMSLSMQDLGSTMMGIMILAIGMLLACTTLFLAITTVIHGNKKTIAMMRAFGYSQKECGKALLNGYRPLAYIGFLLGTVYQYALLRMMVDIVFRDMEGVPAYEFDFPAMCLSLAAFTVIYETVMYVYAKKIKKISVKEIMTE